MSDSEFTKDKSRKAFDIYLRREEKKENKEDLVAAKEEEKRTRHSWDEDDWIYRDKSGNPRVDTAKKRNTKFESKESRQRILKIWRESVSREEFAKKYWYYKPEGSDVCNPKALIELILSWRRNIPKEAMIKGKPARDAIIPRIPKVKKTKEQQKKERAKAKEEDMWSSIQKDFTTG